MKQLLVNPEDSKKLLAAVMPSRFLAKRSAKDVTVNVCNGILALELQPMAIAKAAGLNGSHKKL